MISSFRDCVVIVPTQPSVVAGGAGIRERGCVQDWAACARVQPTCECARVYANSTMSATGIFIFA